MCGLAGVYCAPGLAINRETLGGMGAAMTHRGPDDQGEFVEGPVGLIFRRLAILDLSAAGHQPMLSADQRYVIVFNGEIFNYLELRKQLEELGHRFQSSGDTEVLLHAYIEWGKDCLPKLNGMWAFLIYDRKQHVLFGSRDRFGVKPLYQAHVGGRWYFSSEIKSLRIAEPAAFKVSEQACLAFLLEHRLDEGSETFYEGINAVPPGSAFEINIKGEFKGWQYWGLPTESSWPIVSDPVEEYRQLFEDSVRIRLRSDVPIAVFLSGGMDSTSILSVASSLHRNEAESERQFTAFSYSSDAFDESQYINDTIRATGAKLEKLSSDPHVFWESLKQVLWYHDEPLYSPTALVGFQLARMTSEHGIKVVLNGQGADETAAGYPSYFPHYWVSLLQRGQLQELLADVSDYCQAFGGSKPALIASTLRRLVQAQMGRISLYRSIAARRRQHSLCGHTWLTREFASCYEVPKANGYTDPGLHSVLTASVERSPLPIFLRMEDRNSMANSLEVRLPFLDYRLVSLLFSLQPRWKMRGRWNKYVQRKAMTGTVPDSVSTRVDKMGFPTDAGNWLATDLFDPLRELLTSRQTRERGIFDVSRLEVLLQKHARGEAVLTGTLFHAAQFELWMRQAETPQSVTPT